MAIVYRYTDLRDNIIKYVGIVWSKNRTLEQRIKEHYLKDDWCDNNYSIEYFYCDNRNMAESYEGHFITIYNTSQYFNSAKTNWGINDSLPEPHWIKYQLKNDLNLYKTFTVYEFSTIYKHLIEWMGHYETKDTIKCVNKKSDRRIKPIYIKLNNLDKELEISNLSKCGFKLGSVYTLNKNKAQEYLHIFSQHQVDNNIERKIINLIQQHIDSCQNEIDHDVNMYSNHLGKDIHDEKYRRVIEELNDLMDEVKELGK